MHRMVGTLVGFHVTLLAFLAAIAVIYRMVAA